VKRSLPWLIAILLLAGLCWQFPPFHLRSLRAMRQAQAAARFDAKEFVTTFWTGQLLPATDRAADVASVVETIKTSPQDVRTKFGRTVGVSSSYYLFVRGSGRVVSADAESIGLSVGPTGDEADVIVALDFVFGNAVRDATGLLDSSSYPNAQEFNDISAELNKIVEEQVLPTFRRAATVGQRVKFAGCIEVADEQADLKPLKLVPVSVQSE